MIARNFLLYIQISMLKVYMNVSGTWGEELESQQRYSDLFNCYEQAIEIFPEHEEVLGNLGAHLFRYDFK